VGLWAGLLLAMGCSDAADRPAAAAAPAPAQSADPAQSAPAGSVAAPAASPAAPVADGRSPEELAASGRGVYNANCIACHAMDPRQDGALGPAVAGSSRELLEARVLRAEYPAGYAPKRETRVMVPLPHLESKLPELAAYLDSLQ
jgi:mono/diheme cytochrome c family protein